jgi:hypothetical protein
LSSEIHLKCIIIVETAMGKGGLTKWFKAEEYSTLRFVEYREFKDYSEGELIKLKDYDKITDTIIDDILII